MSVSEDLIGFSKLRPVRLFALTTLIVGVGVKGFIASWGALSRHGVEPQSGRLDCAELIVSPQRNLFAHRRHPLLDGPQLGI